MSEFKQVEDLNLEKPSFCAWCNNKESVFIDGSKLDYSEAIALRDWLNKSLGDENGTNNM